MKVRFEDIDTVEVTDHAMERFGQWLGMSRLPEHVREPVEGNKELIAEEIGVALENPSWDRLVEYAQHDENTDEYRKQIWIVDLRNIFYDEEKDDYWAYFVALVTRQEDLWVCETIMPNGFVTRSEVTGKFRRVA